MGRDLLSWIGADARWPWILRSSTYHREYSQCAKIGLSRRSRQSHLALSLRGTIDPIPTGSEMPLIELEKRMEGAKRLVRSRVRPPASPRGRARPGSLGLRTVRTLAVRSASDAPMRIGSASMPAGWAPASASPWNTPFRYGVVLACECRCLWHTRNARPARIGIRTVSSVPLTRLVSPRIRLG